MSSTTSRVSLYKPAGGENVNVTTDLNNNLDKIDTNLNFRVAASATARNAISPFWAGLNVRDTDTGRTWVSNGSAPISASWSQIPNSGSTYDADLDLTAGKQINIGAVNSTASFAASLAASGDDLVSSRVGAEANSRYLVKADGKTWWGPGGGTSIDTNLYRISANVLGTDDAFQVGGNLILASGGTAQKNANPSSSTTVTTGTETVVASYTIPANDMSAGAVYKLTAFGTISTAAASQGSLQIRGRIGGLAGTQFATTADIALIASANQRVFKVEVYMVCLSSGATGSVFGQLDVWNGAATGLTGTTNPTNFQNQAVASSGHIIDGGTPVTSFDTTVSRDLVITADFTAASGNTFLCRGFAAERLA